MTIGTSTARVTALGDGSTTVFPYAFLIPSASYVAVTVRDLTSGVDTVLSSGQYTITGLNDPDGGSVTISPAPADGEEVIIFRMVPYTQATSIKNQSGFYPATMENGLDWLAMQIQQIYTYVTTLAEETANAAIAAAQEAVADSLQPFLDQLTAATNEGLADIQALVTSSTTSIKTLTALSLGSISTAYTATINAFNSAYANASASLAELQSNATSVSAEVLQAAAEAKAALDALGSANPFEGPVYASKTAAALATIDDNVSWLQTNGGTSPGDNGQAIFLKVADEPDHPGKFQSTDGAWWELSEMQVISPEMFGAVGDGITDDYQALFDLGAYVSAVGGGKVRFGNHKTYYIEQYQVAGSPLDISYSNFNVLEIDLNGSKIDVFGAFERDVDTTQSIEPFFIDTGLYLTIKNGEIDGNVDQMTKVSGIAEANHGMRIRGVVSVQIEDVHTHHWNSDGVYVGINAAGDTSQTVTLKRVRSLFNARQGMSITGARTIECSQCDFNWSSFSTADPATQAGIVGSYGGHSPGAGIDIEPNSEPPTYDQYTGRIFIDRCNFIDNSGNPIVGSNYNSTDDVTITNNVMKSFTDSARVSLSCKYFLIADNELLNVTMAPGFALTNKSSAMQGRLLRNRLRSNLANFDPFSIAIDTYTTQRLTMGTVTGVFYRGETVLQDTSGATGEIIDILDNILLVSGASATAFDTTNVVTGGSGEATATPAVVDQLTTPGMDVEVADNYIEINSPSAYTDTYIFTIIGKAVRFKRNRIFISKNCHDGTTTDNVANMQVAEVVDNVWTTDLDPTGTLYFINSYSGTIYVDNERFNGPIGEAVSARGAYGKDVHAVGKLLLGGGAGGALIILDSAAPTDGTWNRGDIVIDSTPTAGSTLGWVCVTAGTPGTWKTWGAIGA